MAISKGKVALAGTGATAIAAPSGILIGKVVEWNNERALLAKEKLTLESKVDSLEVEKDVVDKELVKEKAINADLRKQNKEEGDDLLTTITTQSEQLSQLQHQLDEAYREIGMLRGVVDDQSDMISSLNEQYHELEVESALQDKTYTKGVESLEYYETEIAKVRKDLEDLSKKREAFVDVVTLFLKGKKFNSWYEFAQALVGIGQESIRGEYWNETHKFMGMTIEELNQRLSK